jgi:hypothetical protein
MAAPTFSVTSALPVCETRGIEVAWIARYLELVAHDVRSNGGKKSSGTVTHAGLTLGTWSYTGGAGS